MKLHTKVYRGKRVMLFMRDGSMVEDRYRDSSARHMTFERSGRVPKIKIRAMSIVKKGAQE